MNSRDVPAVLVIALLAVQEAVRRRLIVTLVVLTVLAVALSGWGFAQLPRLLEGEESLEPGDLEVLVSQLLILVTFMLSFVFAFAAVFLGAPAVASELETGQGLALLARPIRRRDFLLGKWLGLALLVAAYTGGVAGLQMLVAAIATGTGPPRPLATVAFLVAEAVTLLTFAVALSTRLPTLTAGVAALLSFTVAWVGGVVGGIGRAFDDPIVGLAGRVTSLLLPTDGLWRAANHSLEPGIMLLAIEGAGREAAAFPFFVARGPSPEYMLFCAAWIAVVLALAVVSFERRDL